MKFPLISIIIAVLLVCQTIMAAKFTPKMATIDNLFEIYTTRNATRQLNLIQSTVSPQIEFEDPVMRVQGQENYRLQFFSLIKFFSHVHIQYDPANVKVGEPVQVDSGAGQNYDIIVRNTQTYKFARSSWLAQKALPETVEMEVDTTITVNDRQPELILKHQDVWLNSTAFTSTFYRNRMKDLVGSGSSRLFKILGW